MLRKSGSTDVIPRDKTREMTRRALLAQRALSLSRHIASEQLANDALRWLHSAGGSFFFAVATSTASVRFPENHGLFRRLHQQS